MNKEYVPYEIALELNELGFDEPCSGWWLSVITFAGESILPVYEHKPAGSGVLNAPTFSQAFRWFREKHNIKAWVQPFMCDNTLGTPYLPDDTYSFFIFKDADWVYDAADFDSAEKAEIACVKKMIETIKQK